MSVLTGLKLRRYGLKGLFLSCMAAQLLSFSSLSAERTLPADQGNSYSMNKAEMGESDKWPTLFELEGKKGRFRDILRAMCMVPVYQDENSMVFGDIRYMMDSVRDREWNVGVGYRHIVRDWDVGSDGVILGAYAFYDRKRSAFKNWFNMGTFGVEALGEYFQLRGNWYVPQNKTYTLGSSVNINSATPSWDLDGGKAVLNFESVVNTNTRKEQSLKGYDFEVKGKVPVQDNLNVWVGLGAYRFHRSNVANLRGPMASVDVELLDALGFAGSRASLGYEYRKDKGLKAQNYGVLRLTTPLMDVQKGESKLKGIDYEMTRFVQRDVDVQTSPKDEAIESTETVEHDTEMPAASVSSEEEWEKVQPVLLFMDNAMETLGGLAPVIDSEVTDAMDNIVNEIAQENGLRTYNTAKTLAAMEGNERSIMVMSGEQRDTGPSAKAKEQVQKMLARIDAIDKSGLTESAKAHVDLVRAGFARKKGFIDANKALLGNVVTGESIPESFLAVTDAHISALRGNLAAKVAAVPDLTQVKTHLAKEKVHKRAKEKKHIAPATIKNTKGGIVIAAAEAPETAFSGVAVVSETEKDGTYKIEPAIEVLASSAPMNLASFEATLEIADSIVASNIEFMDGALLQAEASALTSNKVTNLKIALDDKVKDVQNMDLSAVGLKSTAGAGTAIPASVANTMANEGIKVNVNLTSAPTLNTTKQRISAVAQKIDASVDDSEGKLVVRPVAKLSGTNIAKVATLKVEVPEASSAGTGKTAIKKVEIEGSESAYIAAGGLVGNFTGSKAKQELNIVDDLYKNAETTYKGGNEAPEAQAAFLSGIADAASRVETSESGTEVNEIYNAIVANQESLKDFRVESGSTDSGNTENLNSTIQSMILQSNLQGTAKAVTTLNTLVHSTIPGQNTDPSVVKEQTIRAAAAGLALPGILDTMLGNIKAAESTEGSLEGTHALENLISGVVHADPVRTSNLVATAISSLNADGFAKLEKLATEFLGSLTTGQDDALIQQAGALIEHAAEANAALNNLSNATGSTIALLAKADEVVSKIANAAATEALGGGSTLLKAMHAVADPSSTAGSGDLALFYDLAGAIMGSPSSPLLQEGTAGTLRANFADGVRSLNEVSSTSSDVATDLRTFVEKGSMAVQ